MEYDYKRMSDIPITIESEYFTITGEPLCTKFYKIENGKITNNGIFPNMPIDIPDPHLFSDFKEGDKVTFTGFIYQWHASNLITGKSTQKVVNMIDVISWKASNLNSYTSKIIDLSASSFKQESYISCKS